MRMICSRLWRLRFMGLLLAGREALVATGSVFGTSSGPIPLAHYSHLYQSYSSVVDSLVKSGVNRKSDRTHAFSLYHDMRINRSTYDNYMEIFDDADFAQKRKNSKALASLVTKA